MQNKEDKEDKEDKEHKEPKHIYFVDGDKFESEDANITGALIKLKLPEGKRGYALYLEGHGKDADQLINDETSVLLEKANLKHFYTVPSASFGIA